MISENSKKILAFRTRSSYALDVQAKITLRKVSGVELAHCSNCKRDWATKKKGGPEKCPYCQAIFTSKKAVA